MRYAYRAYQAIGFVASGVNAAQDIMAGNYLSAGINIISMLANLRSLSRACFTGDTKLMARGAWGEGWRRIDQITTDDEVLSRDEFDVHAPLGWKPVEELFRRFAPIVIGPVRAGVGETVSGETMGQYSAPRAAVEKGMEV